jgi:hypothetical protein
MQPGNSSIVKFGGWDKEGIEGMDGNSLKMIRTITNKWWTISSNLITQGNQQPAYE